MYPTIRRHMKFTPIMHLLAGTLVLMCLVLLSDSCARAGEAPETDAHETAGWTWPIRLFQKTVSHADGNRCPMYPSDSRYAVQAIRQFGFLKGWIMASDRLLRCGRDEVALSPRVRINGRTYTYDPVSRNVLWQRTP